MNNETKDLLVKVPQVTAIFWIAKLCTTIFGEAFSDYVFFNDYLGQHVAILLGLGALGVCLAVQLRVRRYVPWVYWATVTAVSVFGTMSADFLNKDLGMSLAESTSILLVLQALVFTVWYRTERSLDVHTVSAGRREVFYWLTVLFTFALGTAAGDFAADSLGLGTLASSFVFLAIILVPWAGVRFFRLDEVVAFWTAYSITRPLGASVADWLAVPAPYGDGLQLGTGPVSLFSGLVLLVVVSVIAGLHRREPAQRQQPEPHRVG